MSKAEREFKEKTEIRRTLAMLEKQVAKLEKQQKEYLDKAKNAKLKGNTALYNQARMMIKTTIGQTRRLELMRMNVQFAVDQRDFVEHNRNFVRSMSSLGKSLLKTVRMTDIGETMRVLEKSIVKVNASLQELDGMLDFNQTMFDTVTDGDIPDAEIDALIGSEAVRDESNLDEKIDRLFGRPSSDSIRTPVSLGSASPQPAPVPCEEADGCVQNNCAPSGTPNNRAPNNYAPGGKPNSGTAVKKSIDLGGAALRPQRLADYIGQPKAVAALTDPIKKALITDSALPHVLLCGSHGQGKTTLAKIIAAETGTDFIELNASVRYRDMLRTLRQVKHGDIIFIDEIHKLSADVVETVLYPAMEDFELHFTEGNGARTKNVTTKIPHFTLIGATTESGKLLKPFYSKFPIKITLEEYNVDVIAAIVRNSMRALGIRIDDAAALDIARRSRLTPRTANAFVEGISSSAIVRAAERKGLTGKGALAGGKAAGLDITVDESLVREYFDKLGVDSLGLTAEDRKILDVMINMFGGGPVGQDNLAKALNVSNNRIDQEYEPFLVKLGFINVRPQGRYATEQAYEYLGFSHGKSGKHELPHAAPKSADTDESELTEAVPVVECERGAFDAKAAARFEALLTGEGKTFVETLDTLFPDVDKGYDSAAVNQCVLRLPQGREIYCDSKLERRFLSYLFRTGFAADAKSEAVELKYDSASMTDKTYYPDFVVRLHDGRVAVIEMKNLSSIGYHLNIDKYEALAKWCGENGYVYGEIAKDFGENRYVSAAQLKAAPVNEALATFVYERILAAGKCTADDLAGFGYDERELIGLLLNDRKLKNIDRTGERPEITSVGE